MSLFKRRDVTLLTSSLLTAPAFWIFSPSPSPASLIGIVSLGWVFLIVIYAFNRLTESTGERAPTGDTILLAAGLVAFFPALYFLPNHLARATGLFVMALGIVYSLKLRIAGVELQPKRVYLLKPILVSAGHALQWIVFTGSGRAIILLLATWHFLDVFVLTSLLDAADVKEDRAAGVRTFAVVHGFDRTLDILLAVNVLWIVSGIVAVLVAGSLPLALFLCPRALVMQYRLMRLRAGKSGLIPRILDSTLLRVVGLAGIGLHGYFEGLPAIPLISTACIPGS